MPAVEQRREQLPRASMQPRDRIRTALARDAKTGGRPSLVAFVTAGVSRAAGVPAGAAFRRERRRRGRDRRTVLRSHGRWRDDPTVEPARDRARREPHVDLGRARAPRFRAAIARAADELFEPAVGVRLRAAGAPCRGGRRQRFHRAGLAVRGERAARGGAATARLGARATRDAGNARRPSCVGSVRRAKVSFMP